MRLVRIISRFAIGLIRDECLLLQTTLPTAYHVLDSTTIPFLVAENYFISKNIYLRLYVHLLSPEGPAIRGKP
jgi:hypothetical protein